MTSRRYVRAGAVLAFLGLCVPAASFAQQVPKEINFQSRLSDSAGNPVISTVSVVFSLYSTPSGGTPLWSETQFVTRSAWAPSLPSIRPSISARGTGSASRSVPIRR
jgi:hypothetical protein